MSKVSKAYFNKFKENFLEWQHKLGLTQYEVTFQLGTKLDTHAAEITVFEMNKLAEVRLAKKLTPCDHEAGPESFAKHEAIHLLLHRIKWLGENRYIESNDLQEEWEALVRRLEKVL